MAKVRATHGGWGVIVLWNSRVMGRRPYLAGRYWFDQQSKSSYHITLFATRREAREAVKLKRSRFYYKLRIVPVRVTVCER